MLVRSSRSRERATACGPTPDQVRVTTATIASADVNFIDLMSISKQSEHGDPQSPCYQQAVNGKTAVKWCNLRSRAAGLAEMTHHDGVGFAAAAGEGELLSVGGPGEGEHVVGGEFRKLHKGAFGQRLLPDIGCAVAGKQEGDGFAIRSEFRGFHAVGRIESVQG